MAKVKKRGRQRANGEGAISDRKDGRKDVELTIHGPFGTKRLRTTKKNRTEALAWIEQMKREHADGGSRSRRQEAHRRGVSGPLVT
jgi:hypothetical protein